MRKGGLRRDRSVDGPALRRNGQKELKEKENTLKRKNTIKAILDAVASQRRRGETPLIVRIEPDLIQDAMNALPGYRKLFAPVLPGVTDPLPIYEAYERVRQADATKQSVLLLVTCHSTQEFCEALDRLQS
jgi:hypothetical protein